VEVLVTFDAELARQALVRFAPSSTVPRRVGLQMKSDTREAYG